MTFPASTPVAPPSTQKPSAAPARKTPFLSLWVLIIAVTLPIAAGYVGASLNESSINEWFAEANRAPWAIDAKYYPAIWVAMSALAGLSYWCVWLRRREVTILAATVIFLTHILLSTVWLSIFFNQFLASGNKALWIALVLVLFHFVFAVATIAAFDRASKLASWILFPYLCGIAYLVSVNVYSALNNY